MHTINMDSGTRFHFNGDFSGEVIIQETNGDEVSIPAQEMIAVVAEYVRRRRISALENMSDAELLDLPPD